MFSKSRFAFPSSVAILTARRFKSINVSNYETGFNSAAQGGRDSASDTGSSSSLADDLDFMSFANEGKSPLDSRDAAIFPSSSASSSPLAPNRSLTGKYPTGMSAKQRCYNCGQMGHISFDCQQPQVRKACYTCGNSGHLARDCPQSQRPVICYVCRQPGHLASKCPSNTNAKLRTTEAQKQ